MNPDYIYLSLEKRFVKELDPRCIVLLVHDRTRKKHSLLVALKIKEVDPRKVHGTWPGSRDRKFRLTFQKQKKV